jgi:cysteine desulfurase
LEQGWRLDTLGMTHDGVIKVEALASLLAERTLPCLVSVQLANHETGVLQPVAEIAAMCRQAGIFLHTDAVQAVGKIPVSFRQLDVAAMSIAAHKFRGPLGIGALAVRDGVPITPLMFGGHQQAGTRPGTESAALAVGMAKALELWHKERDAFALQLRSMRDRFEASLRAAMPDVVVHGISSKPDFDGRLPQTSNVAFPGLDGQMLLMSLDLAGVACSVGSACSSGSTELSPTLRAMDLPSALVSSSLRFSFGATTTAEEIDEAVRRIVRVWQDLRKL